MTTVDPLIVEIERRRIERGWTARTLEREAGLSPSTYRQLRRRGTCTLQIMRLLCEALGLDIIATPKPVEYSRRPLAPCGTPSAARRHWARGEELCEPCRRATRVYDTTRKRNIRAQQTEPEVAA